MSKNSDEWRTPSWLFDKLHTEFKFDWDVCLTKAPSAYNFPCAIVILRGSQVTDY